MDRYSMLTPATTVLSRTLRGANIRHVIIGGQAGRMLGNTRQTEDVDVLVDCPGLDARTAVAARDARFVVVNHQMVFRVDESITVPIEFLQGGDGAALKMPDVATVPVVEIGSVPVLHPSRLVCLKLRRWMHIAGSTRPQSVVKARNDAQDIIFLLEWLEKHSNQMDLQDLDAKYKTSLMRGVELFRTKFPEKEQLLDRALPPS